MQSAVPVGTVGVLGVEPATLNHKFRYIAVGKIPVGQAVGADLAQDAVSGADALDAFLHKVTMYRTPEGDFTLHIYPKLPMGNML